MIKKILCLLLSALLLVGTLSLSAMAAGQAPQIILQPQNYQYPNYSTAIYTVKASGNNLSATWYLQWQGNTYNLSDNQNGMEPWEAYAGETYGPSQPDGNTFIWFFTGIEEELNGAEIWCVIEDGHYDVTSQRAQVMVGGSGMPAEILQVPAQCKVHQGEEALIRCVASAPVDTQLSYIWYETATGKLQDIQAVNRGTETSDFLICDTTQTGTRYYLCMVQTSQGGIAYSSVIPVTVEESAPAEDTKILTDQLPEAVVGESYSTQLRCNDAKATFSISYNPGKANDFDKTGLTLSADGKLTGTPKAAGSFQFCVSALGTTSEDYMVYTLVVAEAAQEETTEPTQQTTQATEQTAQPTQPTEQTVPATSTEPVSEQEQENGSGLPWWGILLVGIAAAAAGVGAAVLLIKMKKS